ncbi:MAG: ATP-binding protein [Anaerolineae bacterium]
MMSGPAKPEIDRERCTLCGDCLAACPQGALRMSDQRELLLDESLCAYCGDCDDVCPMDAIALPYQVVILHKPYGEVA